MNKIRQDLNSDQVTESTLTYISAKEEHSGSYYCKGEERKSTNEMPIMIFGKRKLFRKNFILSTFSWKY